MSAFFKKGRGNENVLPNTGLKGFWAGTNKTKGQEDCLTAVA